MNIPDERLSPNFWLSEFVRSQTAARRGIDNTPPPGVIANLRKTAALLEEVRAILGAPILISSGYRCPELNLAVGGTRRIGKDGKEILSAHTSGQAADFSAPGAGSPRTIVQRLNGAPGLAFDQLILEFDAWVHLAWSETNRQQVLTIDGNGARWEIA